MKIRLLTCIASFVLAMGATAQTPTPASADGAILSNGNGFADSSRDNLTRGDSCARDHRLPGTQCDERRSSKENRKEGPKTLECFGR